MAIFRVEKNTGYTVMSNHHLRNPHISLKAKGLLSQMLSLPDDWDYTLKGLSFINRESIDAIRTAVWELEKAGYITRRQSRDEKGKMAAIEYVIYEQPQPVLDYPTAAAPLLENPTADLPALDYPTPDNPTSVNPASADPSSEDPSSAVPTSDNPMQINKEEQNTDLLSKDLLNNEASSETSIPSLPFYPASYPEWIGKNGKDSDMTDIQIYEKIIKENIEYSWLCQDSLIDVKLLDEIVSLILETVCSKRRMIRISADDYPAAMVQSKFLKLDSGHIRYVLNCMKQNTTQIRNMKQYLLAVLFNATSTIENYYTSLVKHELHHTNSD